MEMDHAVSEEKKPTPAPDPSLSGRLNRILAIALFTDLFVYGIIVPIIPNYVEGKFGANSAEVGSLVATYAIGLLLLTPVFGVISDNPKVGRRWPMVLGLLTLAGSTLFFMFAEEFYWLFIARFLQGASAAATWVIGLALVADVFPPQEVGKVMGMLMGANGLGILAGPPIGGFMYQYLGYRSIFILGAAMALFDMVVRLLLVSDEHIIKMREQYVLNQQQQQQQKTIDETEAAVTEENTITTSPSTEAMTSFQPKQEVSLRTLVKDPIVLLICGAALMGSMVLGLLEPSLPLYLNHKFGSSPGTIGIAFVTIVIPYIVSAGVVGPLSAKVNPRLVVAVGLVWNGVMLIIASVMPNIYAVCVFLGLLGVGIGMVITPTLPDLAAHVTRKANNNANGQVYAMFNFAYAAGNVGGPLIAGAVFGPLGFTIECVIFAFIMASYL